MKTNKETRFGLESRNSRVFQLINGGFLLKIFECEVAERKTMQICLFSMQNTLHAYAKSEFCSNIAM